MESIDCQMHFLLGHSHLIHTPMDDRHITKLRRLHLLDTNNLAQQPLYPQKSLFMRSSLQISTIGYIRMHLQEIKHALITSAKNIPKNISSSLTNGTKKVVV